MKEPRATSRTHLELIEWLRGYDIATATFCIFPAKGYYRLSAQCCDCLGKWTMADDIPLFCEATRDEPYDLWADRAKMETVMVPCEA